MGDVWSFLVNNEDEFHAARSQSKPDFVRQTPYIVIGSDLCPGYTNLIEIPYSLKPSLKVTIPIVETPPLLPRRLRTQKPLPQIPPF